MVVLFGVHVHLGYLLGWLALSSLAAWIIARGVGWANRDDDELAARRLRSCWENAQRGPADFGRHSIVPEERAAAESSESQRRATLDADEAIEQAWRKGRLGP